MAIVKYPNRNPAKVDQKMNANATPDSLIFSFVNFI